MVNKNLIIHYKDMMKKKQEDMLFYWYKCTCPKCKLETDQYLLWDDVQAADIKCKCSYIGIADCVLQGRYIKPVHGINNKDIIDPT